MSKKRKERKRETRLGEDQVLGVDIGFGMDYDMVLEEFEDFFPNKNGATVTAAQYKG
jgi:hypothetical protein